MFSGIVEELASIKEIEMKTDGGARLNIEAKVLGPDCSIGNSISVNGVCLTVESIDGVNLGLDLSEETLRVTNLGKLGAGDVVNLELSLQLGERIGGHFVSGHVDEVGKIVEQRKEGDCTVFQISAGRVILDLLIDRGSITVDGISLTVTKTLDGSFEFVIIPHTAKLTTLGVKKVGDQVNLEADMIGKYIAKILKNPGAQQEVPVEAEE